MERKAIELDPPLPPPEEIPEERKSLFSLLFVAPTGSNGYEDFVHAVDLLDASLEFKTLNSFGSYPSLEQIARALKSTEIERAIHLVRNGLSKPVYSPHENIDSYSLFPELVGFKRFSNLMKCLISLEFSTGNHSAGIEWIESGTRFAHAIQHKILSSTICGTACDAKILARAVEYVESLSVSECTRLIHILENRRAFSNPLLETIRGECDYLTRDIHKASEQPELLAGMIGSEPASFESDSAQLNQLIVDPAQAKKAAQSAIAQLAANCEHALQAAALPAWRRGAISSESVQNADAAFILKLMAPDFNEWISRCDEIDAQYQILATRVLLRRYRWQFDGYPGNIAVFKEKSLVEDPFTGRALIYKLTGEKYELFSAGPFKTDDNGKPANRRTPIHLPQID